MKKSFFKRSLATLLSLLMVVGMFTVCSVGVLADEAPASTVVTLKEWSVDDLDAYAQKAGSLNAKGKPIYHVGEWVTAITRGANNTDENWMFHSLSFTKGSHFTSSDTLVAKIHYNGDLGTAGKLGFVEISYENRDNYRIDLTSAAIQNSVLNPEVGEGVYTYTVEFSGSFAGAKQGGDDIQFRGKNGAGATFNLYGVELYKKNANGTLTIINGAQLGKVRPAQQQCAFNNGAAQIGRKALISYSNGKTDGNATVELTDADGNRYSEMHVGTANESQSIVKNVSLGALEAGKYTFVLDFATLYGLGNDKFTLQIRSGKNLVFEQKIRQADYMDRNWTPDTGIQRVLNCNFSVTNELAGRDFTYSILFHDQTYLALFGAKLTQTLTVDEAIASWNYQEILDATEDTQVVDTNTIAEKNEVTVGVEANGGSGIWANCNVKGDSVTLTKGQTIRIEQDVFAPKGLSGNLFWRIFAPGSKPIIDASGWENYSSANVKINETYGYAYKTVTRTVAVPDAIFEGEATTFTGVLDHWMFANGADHANYPIRWYDYRVYDNGTDELLYTIKGETIAASKNDGNAVKEPIKVDLNAVKYETGLIATGSGAMPNGKYMKFDYFIKARDVQVGDELEIGMWMDAPNGYADGGAQLGARYRLRKADMSEIDLAPEFFYGQNEIDNGTVSVATHDTLGYKYVPVVAKIALTEEMVTILTDETNNFGINTLIGSPANRTATFDAYPAVLYRYYVKNNTTGVVYVDKLGSDMLTGCGGQFTTNNIYSVAATTARAESATVLAEQAAPVNVVGAAPAVGNYGFKLDVTGAAGAEYTVNVYKQGETDLVATADLVADGTDETIDVSFDVLEAGSKYTFEVITRGEALVIRSASFYYGGADFKFDQVGYPLGQWTHKDMLADADAGEMIVGEYDMSKTTVVGYGVTGGEGFDGGAFCNSPNVTFEEGHVIRFTMKMYAPNGLSNGPFFRVYAPGTVKVLDGHGNHADYVNSQTLEDPTYHFSYKEVTMDVTITADMAAASKNVSMTHHFTAPGQNYNQKPVYWYGLTAYDVTADKVLYVMDGDAVSKTNVGGGFTAGPAKVALAGYTANVGYKAVSPRPGNPTSFPTFDFFTKATDVAVGDVIKVGVWFMPDNGVTEENGIDLNIMVRDAAGKDERALSWSYRDQAALDDALPTLVHDTYGYEYKEKVASFTVDEAQQAVLADPTAFGLNLLFGDSVNPGHDWANYPHSVYRYWLYNETQDKYYVDVTGVDMLSTGGHGTNNELISAFVGNDEYALTGVVEAGVDAIFEGLTANPTNVGNYGYTFNLTGEAGKKLAVKAYAVDGEEITLLASEVVTATGEAQDVTVNFNNAVAGQTVVFGVTATEADVAVATAELNYNGATVELTEDEQAAKAFEALVDALPSEITREDAEAVAAAREAYDALTEAQQALVDINAYAEMLNAEGVLASIADGDAAQAVINLIDALPEEVTAEDIEAVVAAREAYDALTDVQKALVHEDFVNKLVAAEETLGDAIEAAAAQAVTDAINALNEEITADDAEAIEAARAAYEALTEAQKALVAEETVAKLVAAEEALVVAIDAAAAQAVTDAINALNEEITADDAEAIEAARAAFDALTDAQKALVAEETVAKLVAAEEALVAAIDAAAAQAVTDAINALNEEITADDAEAIEAARAALDALTDAQKALVAEETVAKLVAAEEALAAAIDAAAAQVVTDAINALPEEVTEEDAEAVKAARLAYNALTDAQKALVAEETVAKLVAAEEALAINPDQVAADEVIALIEALDEEITLDDKDAVEAARAAFDALTDDQKALVENVEKLTAAEETIATLEKEIADQAAADAAAALIEALPEEITLDAAEDVAAALAAVEALTETQKSLIDQALLAKLTAAEETVAALQQAAEDEAAANAVADAIVALPTVEEVTAEDAETVAAARAAYEALTEAQKALVSAETLAKLVALEEALAEPEITYGDVDGNGKVDAADALKALQHAVKLTTLEGADYTAADVNGDDKIDATDALLMLQYTVKLIDSFPVEEAKA